MALHSTFSFKPNKIPLEFIIQVEVSVTWATLCVGNDVR